MSAADALRGFAGKRVLVTGHTGFKGSWLGLWLTRLGAVVTGYSDCIPTDPSHFRALDLHLDDRRGDVGNPAAVDKVIAETKPDLIFHLAAQALVRRAYSDPMQTWQTNTLGTLAVLEAARRHGVGAVLVATTDKVYRNDESGRRYSEEDELGGSDPYSASKACVELMCRSYRESFVRDGSMLVATVRAGNVIGGGDWAEDRLLPDLMRAAFGGSPAVIRNPQSTRPWQHVLDVLAGYLMIGARLMAGDRDGADAWNLGPREQASIRVQDLLDAVSAQMPQLKIELQPDASGRHESGLLQLDSTKAMTRLAWVPRWEGEMIERTIAWYRAFHEEGRPISADQLGEYEAGWTQ
ncbi:MAG TPA: CDP-glucose 4,6-dehydratase [Sphingomicrobium sp.]|nr:CDP-glucose 4,6-dehydratase [Sphingomicrobium sp.]